MTTDVRRPDTRAILRSLKDFQRDTVEYVFRRMYEDQDITRRFLIADEVGLGKTMVARGLIAKVLDHLWERVNRIDVVYICSNSDIARQNVRKLNVTNRQDAAIASRITLLPTQVADLAKSHVNLVSFTPNTSLDLKSSLGTVEERALLYWMLKEEWQLDGAGPKNVLQGYSGTKRFREHLSEFRDWYSIDPTLLEAFHRTIAQHCEKDRVSGEQDIKARFLGLCDALGRTRELAPEERDAVSEVVGELREILAGTCVRALEPDLIILDEFQRFKHLLEGTDDAGRLARELFEYSDEKSQARVLLLSATPYKMYTLSEEGGDDDHYADFLRTLRFLLADEKPTVELDQLLRDYRREMFRLGSMDGNRLAPLKNDLEQRLRRVMVRTERLAATQDRDGMLVEVPRSIHAVDKADPLVYRALQQVAAAVEQGDTMEYWKSAPYLLNFMDEYRLKEAFREAVKESQHDEVFKKALGTKQVLLPWHDIETYAQIDPGNARLRWLYREVIENGAWQLLWMPPSLPYYKLGAPFNDPRLPQFTKRLVFSSWRVVPKVIATLLSYEAERQMMLSGTPGEPVENTLEARRKRRGLLQFSRTDGRLTGMPVLGMLYPSIVLARDFDPLVIARELAEAPGTVDAPAIVEEIRKRLDGRLAPFIAKASTTGAEDEGWYWAAPILLDLAAEPEATRAWFGNPDLASQWGGEEAEGGDEAGEDTSQWAEHVTQAKFVASGVRPLGRVPGDLTQELAHLALGGPAVTALRALSRVSGGAATLANPVVRRAAARIAMGFRSLFNIPEVTALVRGLNPSEPYWERVLEYCTQGCLQAVLDEYAHIVCDAQGLGGKSPEEIAETVAGVMADAIALRTALLVVEEIGVDPNDHTIHFTDHRMRARFAARLSEEESEAGGKPTRADQVRTAFNSPFWPFVLATTSVGQEGLDFHQYCHAVVHWNLPSNPVDLEQREGRVHRYKGHAVRKNLARQHAAAASPQPDPWSGLFDAAVSSRSPGASDLEPFWVYTIPGGAKIERHVPAYPLSREIGQMDALRRSLAVYRMVFGQPRQEDLVAYLLQHVPASELKQRMDSLRIDLSPPHRNDLSDGQP